MNSPKEQATNPESSASSDPHPRSGVRLLLVAIVPVAIIIGMWLAAIAYRWLRESAWNWFAAVLALPGIWFTVGLIHKSVRAVPCPWCKQAAAIAGTDDDGPDE